MFILRASWHASNVVREDLVNYSSIPIRQMATQWGDLLWPFPCENGHRLLRTVSRRTEHNRRTWKTPLQQRSKAQRKSGFVNVPRCCAFRRHIPGHWDQQLRRCLPRNTALGKLTSPSVPANCVHCLRRKVCQVSVPDVNAFQGYALSSAPGICISFFWQNQNLPESFCLPG